MDKFSLKNSMNQVGLEVLVLKKMDSSFQISNLGHQRKMDFCLDSICAMRDLVLERLVASV